MFSGDHTLIVATDVLDSPLITGHVSAPVLFRGIPQSLEPENSLIFPILRASSTAYGYSPDERVDQPHVAGKHTVLISALQARNNARVVFAGSLDLFSDSFYTSKVQKYTPDGSGQMYDTFRCSFTLSYSSSRQIPAFRQPRACDISSRMGTTRKRSSETL